ncbi:MAG TPA: ATP-binding cassette domain-containing protein [Vicinamibacterales bacterium]
MSLRLAGVMAAYQRRAVFEDVHLFVGAGDILGLIGPNGAGKTTLLRIAAGLIRPAAGHVVADGAVMYFGGEATMPGACRAGRWARLFGPAAPSRKPLGRLSRGSRQMLGLDAFLSRDDWTIGLLDEPWEGLDPFGSRWLAKMLRRHAERGAAIVISSHRLHDAAELCSSYAFLAAGTVRTKAAADIAGEDAAVGAADLARAFEEVMRR